LHKPFDPSLTLSEVALFTMAVDQRTENTGDYHNPTRQRGIFPDTASNAKTQSLAHAAGWDGGKRATSKLTLRVGMNGYNADSLLSQKTA
jgi:hypothetical protein